MKKTKRGFTFVELLVVVAILMIIVALLFPSLKAAHDKATRNQSPTNGQYQNYQPYTNNQ